LQPQTREQVMNELFTSTAGIGLSVLRQPIGANDFSLGNSTYDDQPAGRQDPELKQFALTGDSAIVLPLIRQAQQLNPAATAVLTPWSAPAWMKTNGSLIGGSLQPAMGGVYGRYLARTVAAFKAAGIRVGGITPQNEPSFSPPGYAGMTLSVDQQRTFIVEDLRPALDVLGLESVGIWALDDSYDRAPDATQLMADPAVRSAVAGIAFHCYNGPQSAMADFHAAHPGLPLAISECTGGGWSPKFGSDLRYDVGQLLIQGIRDGASWIAKWNVALDPSGGPANGGCADCRGLLTVDPHQGTVSMNEEYYALGQLGRFVQRGATVIGSTSYGSAGVQTVAFDNPDGSHALLAFNGAAATTAIRVQTEAGRSFTASVPAGAAATFTW